MKWVKKRRRLMIDHTLTPRELDHVIDRALDLAGIEQLPKGPAAKFNWALANGEYITAIVVADKLRDPEPERGSFAQRMQTLGVWLDEAGHITEERMKSFNNVYAAPRQMGKTFIAGHRRINITRKIKC